jgi:phosphate acetyltransferase
MEPVLERLKRKAADCQCLILFPEPEDPRVIAAARDFLASGLGRVALISATPDQVLPDDMDTIDSSDSLRLEPFASCLWEKRRHRGLTLEQARELARQPLFHAGLMVATGQADAVVAGSIATTAEVIRAGLQTIGTAPGCDLVSSFFLMQLVDGRTVTFADCAVVPQPDPNQLATIAITAAASHQRLTGEPPRVAFLSFVTRASAAHSDVDKVIAALDLARKRSPTLQVDGPLQFDAAFDPAVAERKATGSTVAGKANVFVFPDLDAGNIGYKIAERVGGAVAIGPLIQGLRKPYMDLSRGCKPSDIVAVAAVASLLARAD